MRNWKRQTKRMKRIFAMLVAAMLCLSPLQQHVLAAEIPEEAVTPEDTAQPEETTEPEETEVLEETTPSEEETAPNGVTTPVEGEITPDTPEVPEGTITPEIPEAPETSATSSNAEELQGAEETQDPVVNQELVQSVTEAAAFKAAVQEAVANEDPEITGVIYVNANFEPDTTETTETPDDSVSDDVSSEEPEEPVAGETQNISGDDAEANDEASEEDAVKTEETSNEENEDLELTDTNVSDQESEQEADAATPDETVSDETDDVQLSGTVQVAEVVETAGAPIALADEGDVQAAAPEGSVNNPCKTLDDAVKAANKLERKDVTIEIQSDLTATACARINGKDVKINGNGYTITRGDEFDSIADNERSWYNPAMIEVCNSGKEKTASLYLENITLDDKEKTVGKNYIQARSGDEIEHLTIVQDAIIATYDGVGTITLGNNVTLKGYGGMSAVRLSGGTLKMESGSLITGGKNFTTKGGGNGPAGAVWIQGGSFTMEEGAEISGVTGRAVYVDSGSAVIDGIISNVTPNNNMWQGASGVGAHVRNSGQVVLNGTIDGSGKSTEAIAVTGSGSTFTMNKGSIIKDLKKAISAGDNSEVIVNGEITGLLDGSNAVNMGSGAKCTIGADAEIHHNKTWRSAIYCQSGELHIYGWFHHNYNGSDRSGAIEINNNGSGSAAVIYEGARITNNYCKETGGGIMVTNGLLTMKGGEISGNMAGTFGGGVSVRKGGQFVMEGGRITGNASAENGAGVSYEGSDWNGKTAYVDLKGGEISGNKMNAVVIPDAANCTASFTGGVDNDLAVSTPDGPATVARYFMVGSGVTANRNIYMAVNDKIVTVNDGTKLGNANSTDIDTLNKQANGWGFAEPIATLWTQNANGTPVTVSGLSLDSKKPVWVLAKNGDSNTITRIPASLNDGVVSFQAPATTNGCALAVVQPAEGDVYVNLTSTLTRIVQNNLPTEIPYEVTYGLKEGVKTDVLNGAQDLKVTFLLQSGEEKEVLAEENKASLNAAFSSNDFKVGEKIVMGAVLTFTNNDQKYTFYSNGVSIPMFAVYTVTFNSNGGSPVATQTVIDGESASRPTNPTRTGYTFNGWTMGGAAYNFTTPVTSDITLTAQWTANETPAPTPTPTTPTTTTTTTTTPPAPAPLTMAPTVLPAAAPAPAAPAPAAPVEIAEPETPLAEPEAPAAEPEEAPQQIEEPEVPLASGVQGSWALLNLLLMLFTAVSGLVLTVSAVRKEEENEKRKKALRISSLVPAVVSVAVFVLTENLRAPMRFVNARTMWMVLFAAAQIALIILSRKSEEEAQVEE